MYSAGDVRGGGEGPCADGCKVYFKDGGWIIGRFSGTEPLIRIFCEMGTLKDAVKRTEIMEQFLGLK